MAAVSSGIAVPCRAGQPGSENEISFRDAVARAWERLPQRGVFAAQQNSASARFRAGSALFPNAPSATGTFYDDRIAGSNLGYVTSQLELSTPVWLPGEGTSTQRAALAQGDAARADADAAHLALALHVLDLAEQAALARNSADVAAQRLAAAQALAADSARRFRVGEGAEADSLAAAAEAASAEIGLVDARMQVDTARAALAEVTGDDRIPRLADAAASAGASTNLSRHPRIVAATRAVQAAEASARLVRIQNRDDPEIGLQGIDEKQPGTRWDTRVAVVIRFPFATEARNAPRRAAAEESLTQATAELETTRRAVALGVRQAQAAIAAATQTEAIAQRSAVQQEQRRGMIERAWRLGEMPLIEVVRAEAAAFDADLLRQKSRTALAAARLRLAASEGVLP